MSVVGRSGFELVVRSIRAVGMVTGNALVALLLGMMVWGCAANRPTATTSAPVSSAPPVTSKLPSAEILVATGAGSAKPIQDSGPSKIPVTADDPQLGREDAPVTIVEFSDFQCPFCQRVQTTLRAIRETYGDERVRLVWKHNPLPFHTQARPSQLAAAIVFELGGSKAFWKFHDQAFDNQQQLAPERYEAWAVAAGVDVERFRQLRKRGSPKLEADILLARELRASGTPAFFINGVKLSGAQPFEKFKEIIDTELREAAALRNRGVPPAQIYALRTNANFEAPPAPAVEPPSRETELRAWKVPVLADDPVAGPADALVTIVQWSDFQCPFCKRVEPTIQQIREKYPRDVRVVWKDNPLPFHPRAMPAAQLARYAFQQRGSNGFWAMHRALFETQPKLEDEDLARITAQQGLSWAAAKKAIASGAHKPRLEQSMELAAELQARGTPHFFINGVPLSGAQPFEKFQEIIDAELVKARALLDQGTPRAKIYEAVQKAALSPEPPEQKEVAVPSSSPFRGPARAKIVIQEFADFQCPFCKRVLPTLTELEKKFPGQIQLVWRHLPLPFHKDAQPAAEAAEEVRVQLGNRAFWAYHDKLFESLGGAGLGRETLLELARGVGADVKKLEAALDQGTHRERVRADADAASAAGINGTPAFIINGYFLSGAQPLPAFEKLIRRSLAKPKVP